MDELFARVNKTSRGEVAPIDSRYDYDRDQDIDAMDQLFARLNKTTRQTKLVRLEAPEEPTARLSSGGGAEQGVLSLPAAWLAAPADASSGEESSPVGGESSSPPSLPTADVTESNVPPTPASARAEPGDVPGTAVETEVTTGSSPGTTAGSEGALLDVLADAPLAVFLSRGRPL
jgi:hypothetical protein